MSLKLVSQGDIGLLEFVGEKVNKLSSSVMKELEEILEQIRDSNFKAIILISRTPNIFIAGADIAEIKDLCKKEEAIKVVLAGQKIINMLEDLPIPVIAAIHGATLGGGCEVALACDYRICSSDKKTRIGLPEIKLGVIPGFGGCVRLPRVVGLQSSLDIILAGKSVSGEKALRMGLVDRCVPPVILEKQAFKMAQEIIAKGSKKRRKRFSSKNITQHILESTVGRLIVFSKARKAVVTKTGGHYPAPLKALEVIQRTYGVSDRGKCLEIEAQGFSDVCVTDVSKNLINLFYLTEGIKKKTGVSNKEIQPRDLKKVGVLGAGTMGGGIAQLFADKGFDVRMKDINNKAIALGLNTARKIWEKLLKRRRITQYEMQQKFSRISGGTDFDGFQSLDLVVEAIVEDMEIKKKVIGETEKQCHENCVIVTNTSSLSVTEMAKGCVRPENFAGMHFFNPVHKMPLVEVIRGEKTSDEVCATVFHLAKKSGKFPVVVKDGPGFLVNRLLLPYLNEAAYLLEEGVSIERVDNAYLNFGMPMGPLHLIDEIGIDVAAKVAKVFETAFGERAKPSPLMQEIVQSGRLGKKNKKGFYKYDENGTKGSVDLSAYNRFSNKLSDEAIVHRGVFAMINEAAIALFEDRIIDTTDQVDLAMIMGTGFPPFRGGLLKYADKVTAKEIVRCLQEWSNSVGQRFQPSRPLMDLAESKGQFYS